MPLLDPAFGHWFAGFTDGEGCFEINKGQSIRHHFPYYSCRFAIALRSDDEAILREIQQQLGIGRIYDKIIGGNSKKQVRFTVHAKSDCLILCELFRKFPLRAKKSRDFDTWSEAVSLWLEHKPGDSWEGIALLKKSLEAGREYKEREL